MQREREGDLSSSPNGQPAACSRPSPSSQREDWNRLATWRSPRVLREKRARGREKWLKTWWKLEPRPSSRIGSTMAVAHKSLLQAENRTQPACMLLSLRSEWVRRSTQNQKHRRKRSLEASWNTREGRKKTKKERESKPPQLTLNLLNSWGMNHTTPPLVLGDLELKREKKT
jgi:hypothetical protein